MNEIPIYWTNPALLEHASEVTEDSPGPADSRGKTVSRMIRLADCPFFPGGGGQRPDRGMVDAREVLNIEKDEHGIILEISGEIPFLPEKKVDCTIDGPYRWQSRQQHSGQHLLSAALYAEGFETLSVHLGTDYCGIEVDAESVPDSRIESVLNICDRWIDEARPINSKVMAGLDLAGRKLRRPLSDKAMGNGTGGSGNPEIDSRGKVGPEEREDGLVSGDKNIRIIEIQGIDEVGCGGVHLGNTSSIRLILFDGQERIRGRTRLKWLIGEQAVARCRTLSEQGRQVGTLLSVQPSGLADRVREMQNSTRKLKDALGAAEREIGRLMAERAVVAESRENMSGTGLPPLALVLGGGTERIEGALDRLRGGASERPVFLVGGADEEGNAPWAILFEGDRSEDFFRDCRVALLQKIGGRGGGRVPVFRGQLNIDPEDSLLHFEAFAKDYFSR